VVAVFSFIAGMSANADRPAIARAIVELGRTLGLKVVAEGIEEPDQADWLVSLGCPYGQGYLFSRPMGVDATEAFLAADATRRVQGRKDDPDDGDSMGPAAPGRKAAARGTTPLRLVSGE
jgi:predicted signal transduction protein with EAL and GGDEF domain